MRINLPYGKTQIQVEIPDESTVALPRDSSGVCNIQTEIQHAISHPIGTPPLWELAAGKADAVIVINDITRPVPSQNMLECILGELKWAGIKDEKIKIVIANGNHRSNTPDEIVAMIGYELAHRFSVINHDCEDQSNLTSIMVKGLDEPVFINSHVAKASVKILTGLISPHQSAGYSGGRKSLIPGVAGLQTIAKHHSFPIRPYSPAMGWMHGNPFHEYAVQVARATGIDFIVNVVKNWRGEVVRAVAGDLLAAHEAGVESCEQSWVVNLPHKYECVVVTPGGYPRDIDLHQAQKAISSAEQVVTEDGVIVLIASCPEGVGKFSSWFENARTPGDIIERFKREGFTRDQSSKAFLCARALKDHQIIVSCDGISREQLNAMFFHYADSPQQAIDMGIKLSVVPKNLLVLPYAIDCVPFIMDKPDNPFRMATSEPTRHR
jgi:nickel-dependent lactate racemase